MSPTPSTMILPLLLLLTTALAQTSPLEDLIREAIYETNKDILQKHRDVVEITGFRYDNTVSLEVGTISIGNFSTIALKGTPEVKQVEKEDGTSYYFDLAVGLEELELAFDYRFGFSFLSSSGRVTLRNTGNALRTRGEVNTYNGKTKPCDSVLQAVQVDSLGSLDVQFGDSGIFSWFLKHFIKFAYGIGESYVKPLINGQIAEKVQSADFQSMFSKAACSVFDI